MNQKQFFTASYDPECGWHSLQLLSRHSEGNACSHQVVKLGSSSATEDRVSDVASNAGGLSLPGTNSWENIHRKDPFMHALCFILFMKKCSPAWKCRPKGRKAGWSVQKQRNLTAGLTEQSLSPLRFQQETMSSIRDTAPARGIEWQTHQHQTHGVVFTTNGKQTWKIKSGYNSTLILLPSLCRQRN